MNISQRRLGYRSKTEMAATWNPVVKKSAKQAVQKAVQYMQVLARSASHRLLSKKR